MHKWLILLAFNFSAGIQAQPLVIRGEVQDGGNGQPLAGVRICLLHRAGADTLAMSMTDRQGEFELTAPSEQGITLWVQLQGYEGTSVELSPPFTGKVVIELFSRSIRLDEVIIISEKIPKPAGEEALPIAYMTAAQMERTSMITLSHMMREHPGIQMVSDGVWATGLNIRGLGEQRLLNLIDGARIETSSDLGGALSVIGLYDVERVEVIKGAASSLYGTGAMGGVVNIITRRSHYADRLFLQGSASAGFQSVNGLHSQAITLLSGHRSWNAKVQAQHRSADDARSPEGPIPNSGFNDFNLSAAGAYRPASGHEVSANVQLFQGRDIGIPGGRVFPPPATATYRKADRKLFDLTYRLDRLGPVLQEFQIKYSYQSILREVEVSPELPPVVQGNRSTTVLQLLPVGLNHVHNVSLQSVWKPSDPHTIVAGVDVWQRRLISTRERWLSRKTLDEEGQPLSETLIIRGERPVPESTFGSAGLFLQDEIKLAGDRLKLLAGARIDWIRTANEQALDPEYVITDGERNDNPPGQKIIYDPEQYNNLAWSANLGLEYRLSRATILTFNAARAFRAPSLEERYKYIDLGARVELGNPDLRPERGFFIDLGGRIESGRLKFAGNVFLHRLNDLIALAPSDSVVFDPVPPGGTPVKVPALRNTNIDKAALFGFDLSLDYDLLPYLTAYGRLAAVWGNDLRTNLPLPLIPPLNGRLGLNAELGRILYADLAAVFFAPQNRVATGERSTEGYLTVDLLLNSRQWNWKGMGFQVFGGVENLFDRAYRNHLSSNRGGWQLEPGRNFFIRARISW